MNDHDAKARIQRAFEASLSGLKEDPYLAGRVIRMAQGKGEKKMKKKLSLGLVMMLVLMLLSVTALATGIIMSTMTKKVAEMEATGQLITWGLAEKYTFIQAMRDSGYEMDEQDWAILSDESQPHQDRETAADRIVYARFGAVQEETVSTYLEPPETVMGTAPDAVEIFRERFLAENPEAEVYDYLDALGYWLRDEYTPALQAARPEQAETAEEDTALTQDGAEQYLYGYLTEVLSWPVADADNAEIESYVDEATGAWHVSANGDVIALWVARTEHGDWYSGSDLEMLMEEVARAQQQYKLKAFTEEEMEERALNAVAEKYGLSQEQIKRYFLHHGDWYTDDACIRVAYLLRTRNNNAAPWDYAAIVNLTTGEVDDIFTADDLFDRLPLLAAAWDELQENEEYLNYLRFYFITYSPHGEFGAWPIEVQATASEAFWEYGQQQKAQMEDSTDYYTLQMFVNHRYVLPNENQLSEEEAKSLAIAAGAKALGMDESKLSAWQMERTFSQDEGSGPIWRFVFTGDITESEPWRAVIWLDGETGEILHADSAAPTGETYFTDAKVL